MMKIFEYLNKFAPLITATATITGVLIALIQYLKDLKRKRADTFLSLIEKLRFDEKLADTEYLLEYNDSWYNSSFHGSDFEKNIDAYLSYMNYLCYLNKLSIIGKNERNILGYEIVRLCMNTSVKAYLWNIYHYSVRCSVPCSFMDLIEYGVKKEIFPKDFYKNNSTLYEKYLSF